MSAVGSLEIDLWQASLVGKKSLGRLIFNLIESQIVEFFNIFMDIAIEQHRFHSVDCLKVILLYFP